MESTTGGESLEQTAGITDYSRLYSVPALDVASCMAK